MRAAFAAFALLGIVRAGADSVNFDNDATGAAPSYWTIAQTHPGPPAHWVIRPDATAPSRPNVFSQVSSDANRFEFDIAVYDKVICHDGDLSVKFRIRPGTPTRTAGVVWRYQDAKNYYLLHFSADQHNVVFFRVHNGKAEPIPIIGGKAHSFGVNHDIRSGVWYLAKVVFRGPRVRVVLGNRRLFEAADTSIPSTGKTGIWTKGTTEASFDDFRIDKKN